MRRSVAARPENSRLDKSKLVEKGFQPLPDWKDAVARYIRELVTGIGLFEFDDILSNSIGAGIGYGLARSLRIKKTQ